MKVQDFIMNAMMSNPNAKFYWDGCHFMMEVFHGQRIHFEQPFKVELDEATKGIYYVDENNCRNYILYVVYAD